MIEIHGEMLGLMPESPTMDSPLAMDDTPPTTPPQTPKKTGLKGTQVMKNEKSKSSKSKIQKIPEIQEV
eukprot:TRINITY_DN8117_c0_g1_i1.p1 TRINITY_DN8117_c0_g1~~TRINITY_DN8117_c0_g1_i1.p1  ORF type:complete len:69 (-),score=18.10 TRINITY_DN8117_c0_g1_i1:124-330(-)